MQSIEQEMHEIRRRFALGILRGLSAEQLRPFVTGYGEDDERAQAA